MAETWNYTATTESGLNAEGGTFSSRKELIDHLTAQELCSQEQSSPLREAKERAEKSGVAEAARRGFRGGE